MREKFDRREYVRLCILSLAFSCDENGSGDLEDFCR